MKKSIIPAIIFSLLISLCSLKSSAQKKIKYNPDKGFWVLISNVHQKKVVTVQFYSNENKLIYQEMVTNVKLDINRRKVRHKLYRALNEAYRIWEVTHTVCQAKYLVAKRCN